MYTYLEILNGANKGLFYRVRPNLKLGSVNAELLLLDSEVPPLHSQVLLDNKDQLVLVCTNAVYEIKVNDRVMKKTVLYNGVLLQIAKVLIRVKVTTQPLIGALDPLLIRQEEQKNPLPPIEGLPEIFSHTNIEVETPKNHLIKELRKLTEGFPTYSPPASFRLFKSPLVVRVESGPQADDEFHICWGPRDFGPLALEFPIDYPPFPGILFTLTPNEKGEAVFSTKHPEISRVSGSSNSNNVIEEGSKIIAGNSTVIVEFTRGFRDS